MDVTNPLELQTDRLHEHAAHGDVNGISEALRGNGQYSPVSAIKVFQQFI
jgi:hypothetical protein